MTKPVIVLGFGRSGTTWISDIISKVTGKLILFEPFHPSVTPHTKEISYKSITDGEDADFLKGYIDAILSKRHRKMWLMRNHVPIELEKISESFLEQLWQECEILGFKEIRANFLIQWITRRINADIVFIIRHPCAVVSSIKKRTNFWEFGWPGTYDLFLQNTLFNQKFDHHPISEFREKVQNIESDILKYAAMWAITHAIVIPELNALNIPIFYYEHFYSEPFESTRRLIRYIGNTCSGIHPSHLFTPSMTTLKTFHGIHGKEELIDKKGAMLFWEKELSDQEVNDVLELIDSFNIDLYDHSGFPKEPTTQEDISSPLIEEYACSHESFREIAD